MTKKRALMVVNPRAGKQLIKGQMFFVIDRLCARGYIPTVLTTSAKGDATDFARNMAKDYDVVVCCGGDGTLNEIITGMMKAGVYRPIGYIPAGSTNDMANNLGLPKTIKKATIAVSDGEMIFHDVGKFGDNNFFSYIACFGAFTKASYATPQNVKNLLGHFAYILSGALELGNIKSYHTKVHINGKVVEDDFVYVSVSNTKSFAGLFAFPEKEVTLNDGMFEVLLIKTPKNIIEVGSIIGNISKRNFTDDKNMMLFHTNKVRVETEKEVVWTIDGEPSPQVKDVNIEVVRNKIEIIRPHPVEKLKKL